LDGIPELTWHWGGVTLALSCTPGVVATMTAAATGRAGVMVAIG